MESVVKGALANQSVAYQVMRKLGKPSTIAEISKHIPELSERTVRRAIDKLVNQGYAIQTGKSESAVLFALREYAPQTEQTNTMVPFGQIMMNVDDFVDFMVAPESEPLHRQITKRPILSEAMSNAIRQRMAFVIMSAGETGFNDAVMKYRSGLVDFEGELKSLLDVISRFNSSAIWYDHYRDAMGAKVREMHKNNPELFALARDFIVNLTAKEN